MKMKPMCMQAIQDFRSQAVISCTGCNACQAVCPMDIPISRYFALYNGEKQNRSGAEKEKDSVDSIHVAFYRRLTETHRPADACDCCGRCLSACPQKLPIDSLLQEAADLLG